MCVCVRETCIHILNDKITNVILCVMIIVGYV
jgi:hypothetical protein